MIEFIYLISLWIPTYFVMLFSPYPDDVQIMNLINAERINIRAQPVYYSVELFIAAQGHSNSQANSHLMQHDLSPYTNINMYGSWSQTGEIVAAGYESPNSVFKAWLNSPSHAQVIHNPIFTQVGIATAYDSNNRKYWTVEFGRP